MIHLVIHSINDCSTYFDRSFVKGTIGGDLKRRCYKLLNWINLILNNINAIKIYFKSGLIRPDIEILDLTGSKGLISKTI